MLGEKNGIKHAAFWSEGLPLCQGHMMPPDRGVFSGAHPRLAGAGRWAASLRVRRFTLSREHRGTSGFCASRGCPRAVKRGYEPPFAALRGRISGWIPIRKLSWGENPIFRCLRRRRICLCRTEPQSHANAPQPA